MAATNKSSVQRNKSVEKSWLLLPSCLDCRRHSYRCLHRWTSRSAVVQRVGYRRPTRVVPGASEERLPTAFQRQAVYYRTSEPAGTIVVDTADRYLYLIQGNNRAMRYGIGVGRDGFQWQGLLRVSRKAEWPDWTPPPEMINRQPYLPRFMAGGPGNPMGARALYLGATI